MDKLYPVGIQSFEEIINGNFAYVDKTNIIHKLINSGKYYFLSRPRRFGKSLLISTLEAYFLGKKELFKGLSMEKLEKEWTIYPVLHLDLNSQIYNSQSSLTDIIEEHLTKWEELYGSSASEIGITRRFNGIIERAYRKTGKKVVILIDEYDKPMLQAIGEYELLTYYRNTLKGFYGTLKSCDQYIKFAILTGVTRFSKISIFSDLNNLMDISTDERFANICGITEKELYENFKEEISQLADKYKTTDEDIRKKLKEWYDGYHFVENSDDLYNPFSLLNTFAKTKFGSYWFASGTPTFLIELLKSSRYELNSLNETYASAESLGNLDSMYVNPIPILYQSGYLTIKEYISEFDIYLLGFPNKEVEEGFTKFLLPYYASLKNGNSAFEISNLINEIRNGEIDSFMLRLQSFFADTPYELISDLELHYQNVMFIVFRLIGFYTKVEYHTSNGRIDMIVITDNYIYVMEFKFDGSAEEAIKQINRKKYALPFRNEKKKIYKIGVNCSRNIKNIEKWIVE